jgi:glycosyltransferase involved in cell wall biosynthesis
LLGNSGFEIWQLSEAQPQKPASRPLVISRQLPKDRHGSRAFAQPTEGGSVPELRVLHLFNRYRFFGGEEAAVLRMTEAMQASGARVTECFFSSEDWEKPGAPPRWKQALLALNNPTSLNQVRAAHQALGSDLWLAHNILPVLSAGVLRTASQMNVPMALYLHNYRPFSVSGSLWAGNSVARGGLRQNFFREIMTGAWQGSVPRTAWLATLLHVAHALGWYRRVSGWIAVSEFVRERFVEAGVPREKTHVLAYPFMPTEHPEANPTKTHFIFLGRLTIPKGVRVLLKAWEILRDQMGTATPKLIIAGEGELQNEVIQAAAASHGSIDYVGNVMSEAKDSLIASGRALVVPSIWWDPYPTVVYEAFDQGCPVLAARSGGLPESVSHGERGLLHTAGDAAELADQVRTLHSDPATADAMGRSGREWLLRNSGIEFWWERFSKIAAEICSAHRPFVH